MIEKIALQAAWNQRENIFKIFGAFSFLCALPLLFMLMLPSAVFGDFALNTDIFNNNSLIAENLSECENVVWSAVNESHEKITDEIYSKIDLLGENEIGILYDTFAFSDINTDLILCQYSAKTNFKYINSGNLYSEISNYKDRLFYYDVTEKTISSEEGEKKVYTYTVNFVGNEFFADEIFKLTEKEKETAKMYAENLSLFLYGSMDISDLIQINESVLKYAVLISKYAQIYGIEDYFDLICAVMMAESGGRVADVMQASECPYNTKFPRKPNGITDTEYSIDFGIHYLSDCLKSAGCLSPSDTKKISLAIQGYNFGNGYISWALSNYGGYSESNAKEFSDMMKNKLGWNNYGNPQYVKSVFKYIGSNEGFADWGSPFVGKEWNKAVSSEFGKRTDPINGSSAFHEGLDIAYPTGTPINCVKGGKVIAVVMSESGYGHHIRVDVGNGITVLYAHCSSVFVKQGQTVIKGQVIANVGSTGRVTGAHLHLGVLVNGEEVQPRKYISN